MAVSTLYLNGKEINTLYIGGKLFYQKIEPGLYDVNDNFIVSYEESGLDVTRSYRVFSSGKYTSTHKTEASSGYSTLLRYPDCVRIILPYSITKIGAYALADCTNLIKVNIPNTVTNIGDYSFARSSINEITIPDSVTTIGNSAFYNCSSLTSVDIGDAVTAISKALCYNCTSLRYIILPKTLTVIWEFAFQDTNLFAIYYEGTKNEWKTIQIVDETIKNPTNPNALRYYSEEDPWWTSGLERALYWRYVDGKPKLWSQS